MQTLQTGAASTLSSARVACAERFVMDMAAALHRFGTPADELESALGRIGRRLGLSGQFLATPTSVTACFAGPSGGQVFLVRHDQGEADLGRLGRLEHLADDVASGRLELEAASAAIEAILAAPPVWGRAAEVLAYAVCSGAVARLFHGGCNEMLVAAALGLLLGVMMQVTRAYPPLGRLLELSVAILAAVVASGARALLGGALNQTTATLAGLIVLLPGLSSTTALTELATGNLVAGTARLAGAAVRFMQLGFGVAVGTRIGSLLFAVPPEVVVASGQAGEWLAIVVAATALMVILQVEAREVLWVLLASVVGLAGLRVGERALSAELAPLCASLLATLVANGYARVLRRSASNLVVPAMLLLVPGSVGYRSVAALMHKDVLVGMQTAFAMGVNATALVAGALLAGLLLPPHSDSDSDS